MTLSLTTRAGKGAALTHEEVDGNWSAIKSAVEALQGVVVDAEGVDRVEVAGGVATLYGTQGTNLGSFALPKAALVHRGEWAPGTAYVTGDMVQHSGAVLLVNSDHTSAASIWTDWDAGRLSVVTGFGSPSRTELTVGEGAQTLEVFSGLAFAVGQQVRVENGYLVMEGEVTSYSGGTLAVTVRDTAGSGTASAWTVTFVGGGGGSNSGWSRVKSPDLPYTATTADVGALLSAVYGTLTLPDPDTVEPGTTFSVTGYELEVVNAPEIGQSWMIDGGEVITFTAAGEKWAITRRRTANATDYRYEHASDLAFVFRSDGVVEDRQYYGPGWDPFYGEITVELESPEGEEARAVWHWYSGSEVATFAAGIMDVSVGYKVGGEALALRHLADVDGAIAPAAGQALTWDGSASAFVATTPAATTDNAEGIARLRSFDVATLPPAADHAGGFVHISDGDAGAPCLAYSDGSAWRRVTLGAAVSAS